MKPPLLSDRVAIITGASRGIGRAIARLFAAEGARLVVNYFSQQAKCHSVVEEIQASGRPALAIQADISQPPALQAIVDETVRAFGGIDILVNNGGVLLAKGSLFEYSEPEFDRLWAVNVKGTLNCTRSVAPRMIEQRYGRIINITSLAAFGTALVSGSLPYAATKSAIAIITKCCALEMEKIVVLSD